MSTPAAGGPQVPADAKPKRGLSKYVAKFRKAIKSNSDGSKRTSVSGIVSSAPTAAGPSASKAPATTAAPVKAPAAASAPQIKRIARSEIDAERIRKLREKFDLAIEPHEWTSHSKDLEVQRIEKPIRMRVHRTCHKCGTTFGTKKQCSSCEHTRCTKCPRYPVRKEKKTTEAVDPIVVATEGYGTKKWVLTIPSKTGGQPLVRKKPKQRVRRTCHECSTLFLPPNKTCANCGHVRCVDCPRDPAKKNQYPDGYPGDEPSTTRPKKFVCHECQTQYPPVPPDTPLDASPECAKCGHPKCSDCKLVKPRKVIPAPDPEVVKSVEAKLAALNISSS